MQGAARFILITVLATTAAGLRGCTWGKSAGENDKIRITGMEVDQLPARGNLYKLQIYYVTERLLDDQPRLDFWRYLDETAVASEHRRLLAANGMRLGVVGEIAIERINRLIEQTKDVEVEAASPVFARQGYVLDVPWGAVNENIPLLLTGADGGVYGRELAKASTYLRFQCQAATEANATEVRANAWAIYGDPQPAYRQTPTGLILAQERPRFWMPELEVKLSLREGQGLAIGAAASGGMSLGRYIFVRQAKPHTYLTTIMLFPQLVALGDMPRGAKVAGEVTDGDPADVAPPRSK